MIIYSPLIYLSGKIITLPVLPVVEKYVNPITDYSFKRLFGEEPNKDVKMKASGFDEQSIRQLIGLTIKEIEKL